jgi:hypothetical protein
MGKTDHTSHHLQFFYSLVTVTHEHHDISQVEVRSVHFCSTFDTSFEEDQRSDATTGNEDTNALQRHILERVDHPDQLFPRAGWSKS